MTEAALILGADISRVSMAVVIGESWTNAIQPLYMIPVLAITGLSIRDIMGYSVIVLIAMGAIYSTALILF
jgi:short-chain fatty acids transporter